MTLPDPDTVSRREFCKAAVALGGSAGLAACLEAPSAGADDEALADVPAGDPATVPDRQHAWNDAVPTDDAGNVRPPRHHVLRYIRLREETAERAAAGALADARTSLATGLATLERALAWSNEGLLFTVGYSPAYFARFDADLPEAVDLPTPRALTDLEDPAFDTADAVVHLASDVPAALLAAEEALFGDRATVNGVEVASVTDVVAPVDRRTGFVGAGLPREHRDADGVPDDAPIPEEAPLFFGFQNGFRESQATEDRVTIDAGPFAGGTTQHVAGLRTQLNAWWTQERHDQRVAKLFSPTHAAEERVGSYGEKLGDDPAVADLPTDVVDVARDEGVVGHAQKAARAREDGEPLLLRRDFPTTDGDHTGIHFLTLQAGIGDFERVRTAMTGADVAGDSPVGSRVNNGILQYLFVERRGNFLLPPREHRALPTPNPT